MLRASTLATAVFVAATAGSAVGLRLRVYQGDLHRVLAPQPGRRRMPHRVRTPHTVLEPPGAEGPALASFNDAVLEFGGGGTSGPTDQTWSWNGVTWSQLNVRGPAPRMNAMLAGP